MQWRPSRAASRRRYVAKYDATEAERYAGLRGLGWLAPDDQDAYLADLQRVCRFRAGMRVLDVGAGTGTLCALLNRCDGLEITALEPAPAMLAKLRSNPSLRNVASVQGFCDSEADRSHFGAGGFDVVASRQLVNGLFDPITAFRNWHYWLAPRGRVIVVDGLYGRSGWTGPWREEIDVLPLSACETMALVPYLLETSGFQIEAVEPMTATNQLTCTRTARYLVVALKPG